VLPEYVKKINGEFVSILFSAFSTCLFRNSFSAEYRLWSCFVYWFSSRMSNAFFALNRYLTRLTTFVIESISPKFNIRTIFPISVVLSASNAVWFALNSSGLSFANFSAKSGMYTSPMQPIIANHRSSCLLKTFCAM